MTFATQLFTALHASSSVLIFDEGNEIVGSDESRYAVGDCVRFESGTEEFTFPDQPITVASDGHCQVHDEDGRTFNLVLQVARPLTEADLEKKP